VCAHQPLSVCYKAGSGLLDPSAEGAFIAHSRLIKSPIGIAVYDEHGRMIPEPWARVQIEERGKVVGAFTADAGTAFMRFSQFGRLEVRYFVIGASTSAPVVLGRAAVMVTDCDLAHTPTPNLCAIPEVNPNTTTVECSGRAPGSTCTFSCASGYVLSNPARATAVCEGFGEWDVPTPKCLPIAQLCNCTDREAQFCLPASGIHNSGICVNGKCEERPVKSLCSRNPRLEGKFCDACGFQNCTDTTCKSTCNLGLTAVCVPSAYGGWWDNTSVGSCR